MDLSFFPLTLEAVDQAAGDALCLFVEEDERPLSGLAGLADWRLRGGLSRFLRAGLVKGTAGEALLTLGTRLGFKRMFLFGMGPRAQSEEELAARLAEAMKKLAQAGVEDAAFQLPDRLSLDLGVRTLIDEAGGPGRAHVFGPDPAALVRALSHAASRGGSEARHERRIVKVPGPPKAQSPLAARAQQPPRAAPLEIPKASPLHFAPTASQAADAKARAIAEADAKARALAEAEAEEAERARVIAEADAEAEERAQGIADGAARQESSEVSPPEARPAAATAADSLSNPPYAPVVETPLPPVQGTPVPPLAELTPAPPETPVTQAPPAAQAEGTATSPPPPRAGQAGTIAVTRKPERFVPPAPKPNGKGKKKKR